MSKPKLVRLKRLEGTIAAVALSATTQTLRRITNLALWLRTTIAATQTINLPASTGKGGYYRIFIGVTATGNKVIRCNGATDNMQGQASMAGGTPASFATASNSNTITLNGTTTGGVLGSVVELWDVFPGVWSVQVNSIGTGVQVTPFSNT